MLFYVILGSLNQLGPLVCRDCKLVLESDMGRVPGNAVFPTLFALGLVFACFWVRLIRFGDRSKQIVKLALQSRELCLLRRFRSQHCFFEVRNLGCGRIAAGGGGRGRICSLKLSRDSRFDNEKVGKGSETYVPSLKPFSRP